MAAARGEQKAPKADAKGRAGYYDVVDGVLVWHPATKAPEPKSDDTPAS